jgi:hypothetical protein
VTRRLLFLLPLFLALPARAQTFNFLDDEAEAGGYDVSAQITALPGEIVLAQAENGDSYNFKLTPKTLQLWKTNGKKSALVAQSALSIKKFPASLVAQRRGAHWRFLVNNQSALEAEDDAFSEGRIGTRGGLKDARVQPVEPVQFADDFMRVASDVAMREALQNPRAGVKIADLQLTESIWKVEAGRFATTGLTENAEAQVAQSANPFAFRPLDKGNNLALSGRPFWNDYSASVSVQPQGASEFGLLVYAQDAKNYLGLFWNQNGPQLRAVVNGAVKILDSAPNFEPFEANQWFRLRLQVAGGQLRGFIDDAEVVRARTGLFGRGQVGLWAKLPVAGDDKKGIGAVFDDAEVRSVTDFSDDFSRVVPGRWKPIAGAWNWRRAAQPTDARGAFAVTGQTSWTGYAAAARLQVPADGAAGLLLHHQPKKGAYLLRVTGSKAKSAGAGRAQIVLIAGGKTRVLGESALKNRDASNLRWELRAENGYLSARVGDELVVDAFDASLKAGRAGIYAQNGKNAAKIADFAVEFPRGGSNWAKVPDLYEVEQQAQTMGGWSTPQGFWVARRSESKTAPENVLWHKGEFFGDEDVRFALPDLSGNKTLKMFFGSPQSAKLTLVLSQKEGRLNAALSDGKANWSGQAAVATGAALEIARRGHFFIVRSGESVILAQRV